MIKIIPPNQFVTKPWKNGKGKTTELTISPNSSIDDFSYRLSIADVTEDGLFSNFSGLHRKLILLHGQGLKLTHDKLDTDLLKSPLSYAFFNGGSSTFGELINGPIVDFNLMYDPKKYQNTLITSQSKFQAILTKSDLTFIYSPLNEVVLIRLLDDTQQIIPAGHLIEVANTQENQFQITSKHMILIQLTAL